MSDETVIEAPAISIAETMAKSGREISGSDIFNQERQETKAEAPATQVEMTATPASKAEEPKPVQETKPVQTEVKQEAPKQEIPALEVKDWTEVLKQKPDTEVLKALGFDDKWVGFLSHVKSGGDIKEYMENLSTDYSKLTAEDVMRRQLRSEFPEMDKEDFEEYYRMKVTEAYKLDPDMFTEAEVKRGKIMLNADAKKTREGLVESQKKYLLSPIEAKTSPEVAEYKEREKKASEALESYKTSLAADPIVQGMVKDKKITVGEGPEAFDWEVQNPQDILDVLVDGTKAAAKMANPDGSTNIQKQILIGAILNDDKTFLSEYAKHFKTLGAKEAIMPLENASGKQPTPSKGEAQPASAAEAMAKGGRIVTL